MNQDSAQSIVSELHQKRSALCGALARDLSTREAVRSARYCYALAESRVDVDAHGTVTGRNAEALKNLFENSLCKKNPAWIEWGASSRRIHPNKQEASIVARIALWPKQALSQ